MTRTSLAIFLAVGMAATVGCTSKNYVKQQTTPLINKTNELDDLTAKNSKDIKDVDARAQAGIQAVNAKTADVEQKAQAAGQSAASAQQVADAANSRVSVLTNTLPAEKASHAIGLAYGIAGLGNAAGPLAGGLLTQTLGWRAVFWLLVPLAATAFIIGMTAIPETSDETVPRRVDLSGLALIVFGIGWCWAS